MIENNNKQLNEDKTSVVGNAPTSSTKKEGCQKNYDTVYHIKTIMIEVILGSFFGGFILYLFLISFQMTGREMMPVLEIITNLEMMTGLEIITDQEVLEKKINNANNQADQVLEIVKKTINNANNKVYQTLEAIKKLEHNQDLGEIVEEFKEKVNALERSKKVCLGIAGALVIIICIL